MVTLPLKTALPLIADLGDEAKVAGAWPRLQALIAGGQATLEAALFAQGVESRRVVAESVEEVRFATEYQPPEVPDTAPGSKLSLEALKIWPVVGITPTSFDTRKIGQTLTLMAVGTLDPKVFVCSFEAHHVRLEKNFKFDAGRLVNGDRLFVEQPFFSDLKDSSQAVLESGQPKLTGVHVLPGPEGLVELFLLTLKLRALPTP